MHQKNWRLDLNVPFFDLGILQFINMSEHTLHIPFFFFFAAWYILHIRSSGFLGVRIGTVHEHAKKKLKPRSFWVLNLSSARLISSGSHDDTYYHAKTSPGLGILHFWEFAFALWTGAPHNYSSSTLRWGEKYRQAGLHFFYLKGKWGQWTLEKDRKASTGYINAEIITQQWNLLLPCFGLLALWNEPITGWVVFEDSNLFDHKECLIPSASPVSAESM